MAQKRINDLQLRSDFDATCNFPSDDLVQTWRVTGAQVLTYINANIDKFSAQARAVSTKTTTYLATLTDSVILGDATSGAFTITLPAANTATGRVFTVKKIDSSLNAVTVDPNSTELIDGDTTASLSIQNEAVNLVCDGTAWYII